MTIGENRKVGFMKVREKKSAISEVSETSAFSTWPTKTWMFKIQDFQALIFHIVEHFDKSKLMISGHVSNFSSFMPILVLVEEQFACFVLTIW